MAGVEEQTYTIQVIEDEDIDNMLRLLRRTFYIDEPIRNTLIISDDGIVKMDNYSKASISQRLSYKAVDKDGNIVAVTINEASTINENYHTEAKYRTAAENSDNVIFKKLMYIVAQRALGADLLSKYPGQVILEVKIAATDPPWRRKGIMNALVKVTEGTAKRQGIKLLRMDTTSAYSAKSAERLGFKCIYEARFSEVLKDGEPLIVPKPPHLFDRVFIKELID